MKTKIAYFFISIDLLLSITFYFVQTDIVFLNIHINKRMLPYFCLGLKGLIGFGTLMAYICSIKKEMGSAKTFLAHILFPLMIVLIAVIQIITVVRLYNSSLFIINTVLFAIIMFKYCKKYSLRLFYGKSLINWINWLTLPFFAIFLKSIDRIISINRGTLLNQTMTANSLFFVFGYLLFIIYLLQKDINVHKIAIILTMAITYILFIRHFFIW